MAGLLDAVELGEPVGQGEVLGEDRLDEPDDLHDLGGRVGAHGRQGPLEVLAGAHRVVGATVGRRRRRGSRRWRRPGSRRAGPGHCRAGCGRARASGCSSGGRGSASTAGVMPSRSSRRTPRRCSASASARVGQHPQVDGRAGVDEGRVALDALRRSRSDSGTPSSGNDVRPARSSAGPGAAHLPAQLRASAASRTASRSLPVATGRPSGAVDAEGDPQVRRARARRRSPRGATATPGPASQHASRAPAAAGRASGRARAGRRARGRARARGCGGSPWGGCGSGAVTSSSRKPGTCQSKPVGRHLVEHARRGCARSRRPAPTPARTGT